MGSWAPYRLICRPLRFVCSCYTVAMPLRLTEKQVKLECTTPQKENQLICYSQRLDIHPNKTVYEPDHSTVMYIIFCCWVHCSTIFLKSNSSGCLVIYRLTMVNTTTNLLKMVWRSLLKLTNCSTNISHTHSSNTLHIFVSPTLSSTETLQMAGKITLPGHGLMGSFS